MRDILDWLSDELAGVRNTIGNLQATLADVAQDAMRKSPAEFQALDLVTQKAENLSRLVGLLSDRTGCETVDRADELMDALTLGELRQRLGQRIGRIDAVAPESGTPVAGEIDLF